MTSEPRFAVGAIYGHLSPGSGGETRKHHATFYVYDRANACRIVHEFRSEDRAIGQDGRATLGIDGARERAHANAARLNMADRRG